MLKIEFDETNLTLVFHVAMMLNKYANVQCDEDEYNGWETREYTPHPPQGEEIKPDDITPPIDTVSVKIADIPPVVSDHAKVPVAVEQPVPNQDADGRNLDGDGFIWDKRIHSSGKSFTKAGTWKVLRKPKSFETHEQWEKFVNDIRQSSNTIPPVMGNGVDSPALSPDAVPAVMQDPVAPITDFSEFVNFITNDPNCPLEYSAVLEIAAKHGMKTSIIEFGNPEMSDRIPLIYNEIMGINQ